MRTRLIFAALTLTTTAVLTACASSGGGSTTQSTGAAGGAPTDAAGLMSLMSSAGKTIHTGHVEFDMNLDGQHVRGSGDERLSAGTFQAMHITETGRTLGGTMELIIVNGKEYAKLPKFLNKSGKPWVQASENSSNPVARSLAQNLDQTLGSASVDKIKEFVRAARSVEVVGDETLNGTRTTHYSIKVDLSKLHSAAIDPSALKQAGLSTLPIQLYIDDRGLPRQVTMAFQLKGHPVTMKMTAGDYDKPVTITAPPADQVATD